MHLVSPTCLIIVDFDNFFKKEIARYSSEEIELQLKDVLRNVLDKTQNVEHIEIRLYGGWLNNGVLTTRASQVAVLISQINIFPILRKSKPKVTGEILLAKSLRSHPEIEFTNTYRERDGLPRFRIAHEKMGSVCNLNRKICPPYILYEFTETKPRKCHVSECNNSNMNVFKAFEQKMVDGMIGTDLISIAEDSQLVNMTLLSDDYDHVPSLVYAAKVSKGSVHVGVKNQVTGQEYQRIFSGLDIEVFNYE